MKKLIFVDIVSSLFIILFLYTGIYKLLDLHHFLWALHKSPLLETHNFDLAVGYTIPPIEVLIGLFLLIPFFVEKPQMRKWGLYGAAILMSVFAIYISYMVELRTDRPCTCGGIISQMNWHQHMYFNWIFTALGWTAVWFNNKILRDSSHHHAAALA